MCLNFLTQSSAYIGESVKYNNICMYNTIFHFLIKNTGQFNKIDEI